MFIGREKELSKLTQLYNAENFQFPVIYGRRRVGKTALINEFIKDKDAISFTGIESTVSQNLENLSRAIHCYMGTVGEAPIYPSFQAALETVFRLAENKRIVFVIDEYPYVAKAYKAFSSIIQTMIDKYKDTSKLYLILCGSSMSFKWGTYKISELFKLVKISNMLSKEDLNDKFLYPAYSSDSTNNGIVGYTDKPEFICDDQTPVYVTFGDHTRSMNIARKSFSVLDNVIITIERKNNC
ncbi:MAG: AAA family ATPase [Clostridia bacterium]|nr:AAA family ATPase [Clostridia bacterium]